MAKLGKHKISAENPADRTEGLGVEVEINVSKDGEFYFTLNEEQVELLQKHGVDLKDALNRRTHKVGTFYAKSLDELKDNFKKLLEEAVSGQILEDRNVILYEIRTFCAYCMSEGVPVPNGYYVKDDEKEDGYAKWYKGTDESDGSWGLTVYAQIYRKQVIKFKSGNVKTFFWAISYNDSKKLGEYGTRLNHLSLKATSIRDAHNDSRWGSFNMGIKKEMDYTEENAKFFYDLLLNICKLNERIKDLAQEPEKLQQVISSQTRLLQEI